MSEFDFSNLGKQISDTVHEALNSKEVKDLKDTIKSSTSVTMEEIRRSVAATLDNVNRSIQKATDEKQEHKQKVLVPIKRNAKDKSGSIVLLVMGIIFAIIFGGTSIGFLITSIVTGLFNVTAGALGIMTVFCIGLSIAGGKRLGLVKRFKTYTKELEKQGFASIEKLGELVGKEDYFVIKDLKKMLGKSWFLEGHFDMNETCFIATDKAYNQYLNAEEAQKKRKLEEELRQSEIDNNPEAAAVKEMVDYGKVYLDKIRKANDDIPQKEISDKLARLELVSASIFNYVEAHPNKLPEIRKFINYYMPTTLKLVEAYKEFNEQPLQGDNIISSKKEIEDTLDKINLAFENLLNQLYGENMLDISSDISALSTMLSKEGLLGSDFKEVMNNG